MDNKAEKTNERRSEWVRPELNVLEAGDAETFFNANSDGATQTS